MNNLLNFKDEEISNFLLNGQKADALELGSKRTDNDDSKFVQRTIYKDKNIEIIFSYLKVNDDDIIQQFLIYSKWWGRIKNSYFTLNGMRGKTSEIKCGVININELKQFNFSGDSVPINNKNQVAEIKVVDFNSLVAFCQRKFKRSPTYEVVEVISLSPNSWVRIKITMPNGKEFTKEGVNKKEAANKFATNFDIDTMAEKTKK